MGSGFPVSDASSTASPFCGYGPYLYRNSPWGTYPWTYYERAIVTFESIGDKRRQREL